MTHLHSEKLPDSRIIIVAGVDLSPHTGRVIASARQLTRVAGSSELHIVHVIRPGVVRPGILPLVAGNDEPQDIVMHARTELEDVCARSVGVERPRVRIYVRVGDVVAELCSLADEIGADYLVVGTVCRRGLSRILHGSVAARLLRTAPCSVLTVRSEREAHIEPPCQECVEARSATGGAEPWCARHAEHHVHAHTYHSAPPSADGSSAFRFHG